MPASAPGPLAFFQNRPKVSGINRQERIKSKPKVISIKTEGIPIATKVAKMPTHKITTLVACIRFLEDMLGTKMSLIRFLEIMPESAMLAVAAADITAAKTAPRNKANIGVGITCCNIMGTSISVS